MTARAWKPNGEKCPETNVVNGNGVKCSYHENGRLGTTQIYTHLESERLLDDHAAYHPRNSTGAAG